MTVIAADAGVCLARLGRGWVCRPWPQPGVRPSEPFRALTQAVSAAFPGCLPYGGGHDDVVPHLTIGARPAGGAGDLRAAEADVQRGLPIQARISCAWLMTGHAAPGSWQTVAELPLAAA